jgi:hypothetical protein
VSIARYFSPYLRRQLVTGAEPEWLKRHSRRSYIVACAMASLPWADRGEIALLRQWSRVMTIFTGIPHVLDHIIPLQHPHVCGLTVPWNLQVIPYAVNAAKSNKWAPDQVDMFAKEAECSYAL